MNTKNNRNSIARETSLAGRTIRRKSDGVVGAIIAKKNASQVYEVMWWLDSGGVGFGDMHRRDFDIEPENTLGVGQMRENTVIGKKVKHQLNMRVGIVVGFTHYSKRDRDGELEIKWLHDDGSVRLGRAHRCEVEFVEDKQ